MRILFVAMPDSVHSARWINQLAGLGWDIHVFSCLDTPPHPGFRDITVHGVYSYRPKGLEKSARLKGFWPFKKGGRFLYRNLQCIAPALAGRPQWLASVVDKIQPDIIHSLEFQHSGYLTLDAKNYVKKIFPKWIATNWGSDIYWFGRFPDHANKIRSVLSNCDYYSCECQRDVVLGRKFGFKGEVLPVVPNSGGFDLKTSKQLRQPGTTSERRLITLKGYQNWAGRALTGLRAVELCADVLRGYRIAVYLADRDVRNAAKSINRSTGISIDIIPYSSHEKILELHGHARVSIGLSITDGLSISFLEALVMGSFPIQSDTGGASEWIEDGKNGILVSPEDTQAAAKALRKAVTEDNLVNRAAELNLQTAANRLDYQAIRSQVISTYENIYLKSCAETKGIK